MDTKLKKWKTAGRWFLFLEGLYLTMMAMLANGLYVIHELVFGDGIEYVREKLESDYQNTDEFRVFVGDKLEELLGMAEFLLGCGEEDCGDLFIALFDGLLSIHGVT